MKLQNEGPSDPIVVLVTATNAEELAKLGHVVVDERLAACVTIVPSIRSIYRWEGDVHDEGEALGIIKTTRAALGTLQARWNEIHPYRVPEFLALSVDDGLPEYCRWIAENTNGAG